MKTTLTGQKQRLLDVLRTESALDATPIIHDDETHTSEEYVTLVYEFHHVILPTLEDDGLVEFDRYSDTVTRGPEFKEKYPFSIDSTER